MPIPGAGLYGSPEAEFARHILVADLLDDCIFASGDRIPSAMRVDDEVPVTIDVCFHACHRYVVVARHAGHGTDESEPIRCGEA